MSNAHTTTLNRDMLVLTDQAGNHFLLPQETLERSRVPEEHRAELECLMAAATQAETGEADAEGYATLPRSSSAPRPPSPSTSGRTSASA